MVPPGSVEAVLSSARDFLLDFTSGDFLVAPIEAMADRSNLSRSPIPDACWLICPLALNQHRAWGARISATTIGSTAQAAASALGSSAYWPTITTAAARAEMNPVDHYHRRPCPGRAHPLHSPARQGRSRRPLIFNPCGPGTFWDMQKVVPTLADPALWRRDPGRRVRRHRALAPGLCFARPGAREPGVAPSSTPPISWRS